MLRKIFTLNLLLAFLFTANLTFAQSSGARLTVDQIAKTWTMTNVDFGFDKSKLEGRKKDAIAKEEATFLARGASFTFNKDKTFSITFFNEKTQAMTTQTGPYTFNGSVMELRPSDQKELVYTFNLSMDNSALIVKVPTGAKGEQIRTFTMKAGK